MVGLGALALAASAAFFWRTNQVAPAAVVGEPPPSASVAPVLPAPSAAPTPEDPLARCTPAVVAAGESPLLDDFEDGDTKLPWLERRSGFWIVYDDGTGLQKPRGGSQPFPEKIPGGREQSLLALHTRGSGFKKWGAVLSTQLSARGCYDASVYDGVRFWARGRGKVVFAAMMSQVVSEKFGGSCVGECLDAHVATIDLQKDWTLHTIRWEDLKQVGTGPALDFDARSLFSFSFTSKPEQASFDYWLDDLSFVPGKGG